MQFVGKHKGVLMEWSTKSRKGEGVDVSTAKIEIRMNQKELGEAMSEWYAERVFAFLRDDPQLGDQWVEKGFTPTGVFEEHTMMLTTGGAEPPKVKGKGKGVTAVKSVPVQPIISKVKPVKGEEKVDVLLTLQFPCKDTGYAGKLHMAAGNQVTLEMVIREPGLPGMEPSGTTVVSGKFGNPKHVPA